MHADLSKLFDLTGRVALVTGGSKGLGKAMARGLAMAGADIFISARNADELKASLANIMAGCSGRGEFAVTDMTDRAAVARLAETAIRSFGRVDILINNAGSNAPEPIDQVSDSAWDRLLELNLSSVMAMTRAVAPSMKAEWLGPRRSHLVDFRFGLEGGEERLFGDQVGAPRPGPGVGVGPRPIRESP